jgi:prolyl-tRNA synthetase
VLTPQGSDFPQWFQDVIAKAGIVENGAVRGTMVLRPWGYAIWERMQAAMDARIKRTGHQNVYFPLFIPESFLHREAKHVEGFSPELAVVTHGGGSELAEPVVVRPTSETLFGQYMSKWVQGYRDLPLLLNQWANVVRWELRPRLLLRTTEFLWQEGHTAHATWEEALDETLRILHRVYADFMRKELGLWPVLGRKTEREKFAGAEVTYALEGLMRDGKALQLGTSHHLGDNFARAFEIDYTAEDGTRRLCYTTSWGASTRMLGGLIMAHGDDHGLRLPPRLAPREVVVMAIKPEAVRACEQIAKDLRRHRIRVELDADVGRSFGRRVVDWELKGVPLRVEVGPRDLEEGNATVVVRADHSRAILPLEDVGSRARQMLKETGRALADEARLYQEAATRDVTREESVEGNGFIRMPWDALGVDGEARLAARGYTVRCLTRADGTPPNPHEERDLVAWIARAY